MTQNKDDDGLVPRQGALPVARPAARELLGAPAVPMAGKDRGFVLIPEVGDEVLVGFEREDLRFPYVLGALWNGKDKPPFANDDGKNDKRMLQSRKNHYCCSTTARRAWSSSRTRRAARSCFDDNGIALQDEKGNNVKIDSNSGAMTIEANGQLNIKAATISIEATGTLELKASATLTVRGALVNIN